MTVIAQALAGIVLALALADGLACRSAGLLALAALRGGFTALALAADGLFLAAGLTALGTAGVAALVWSGAGAGAWAGAGAGADPLEPVAPPLPWQAWAIAMVTTGLALGAGAPGVPLAILMAGLLSLLARPVVPVRVLALTTMQLGIALLLPTLAGRMGASPTGASPMLTQPAWLITAAASLPLAAGVIALHGWLVGDLRLAPRQPRRGRITGGQPQ